MEIKIQNYDNYLCVKLFHNSIRISKFTRINISRRRRAPLILQLRDHNMLKCGIVYSIVDTAAAAAAAAATATTYTTTTNKNKDDEDFPLSDITILFFSSFYDFLFRLPIHHGILYDCRYGRYVCNYLQG